MLFKHFIKHKFYKVEIKKGKITSGEKNHRRRLSPEPINPDEKQLISCCKH